MKDYATLRYDAARYGCINVIDYMAPGYYSMMLRTAKQYDQHALVEWLLCRIKKYIFD